MKYQNLKKNVVYTFKIEGKRRLYRGFYKSRYYNKVMKQWYYCIDSLYYGEYFTLPAKDTIILLEG